MGEMAGLGARVMHGSEEDVLYVSDEARRCAACNEVKSLKQFHCSTKGSVTLDCKKCIDERKKTEVKRLELEADNKLANALSRENARRALIDPAPRMADAVKEVVRHQGGMSAMCKRAGRAIRRAMQSKDPDVARKSAMGMVAIIGMAEKSQNESFDINSLSPEDRLDILMEPARQLILRDAEFRRTLLNDPEIRRALLSEAGTEVIEAQVVEAT
jgi:hypothetical protein